ncbi:unnamed protein product [Calypogeia fissa]
MASTSASNTSTTELENEINDSQLNDSVYRFYHGPNPEMAIIFFHDMYWRKDEKPHLIWRSRTNPSVCWPQKWLPEEYPNSQILSIHYSASIQKTSTDGHMDLFLIGENLYQDILQKCAANCPIFLVGHGAGGLVIKKVIVAMKDALPLDEPNKTREYSFLKNVKGIFYYSTPHSGLYGASWIKCLPECLLSPLLDTLQVLSTPTSRLNQTFEIWRQGTKCKTFAILAAGQTKVCLCWYTHIVEEASARVGSDNIYTDQESDHFNVCKPTSRTHGSYMMLVKFIRSQKEATSSQEEMPTNSNVPPSTKDNAETYWKNYVAQILNGRYLKEGFMLAREDAEEIQRFVEVWDSLERGLKENGLRFEYADSNQYVWKPVTFDVICV